MSSPSRTGAHPDTLEPGGVSHQAPARRRAPDGCGKGGARAEDPLLVAVVWQFTIHERAGGEFERFFGADGDWTRVSRRSRSFLGSSFLKDLAAPTRYLLVEYWSEMLVYEKHVADFDREMKLLEERRQAFVESVESLGVFTALDVPERDGPAWSRRSGR